jgi:mannose-6-phosphate isomerase-like protein (cupin superfamily)
LRGISFTTPGEVEPTDVYGTGVDARLVRPEGFPLWLVQARLAPEERITWGAAHGDEAVYLVSGDVELDGRRCPAGGAVIVEAGVGAELVAPAGAEVVHVGRRGGPTDGGRTVHVVGPGGTYARAGDGRDTRYFADSECPTCDVTLFTTGRSQHHESPAHSHSSDELLHVLDGEVVVGRRRLGPGSTIAIHADRRYAFRSEGFRFLNYRPTLATMTVDRAAPPIAEGPTAHGFDLVMDLR